MTSTTADAATGVPQDSNPTPAPKRITAAAPNASTPPEMPHGGLATDQPTWCRKELGHVLMHQPPDGIDTTVTIASRGRQEVEAESVAFLVASAHGMDTASYSFPYVAGWARRTATASRGHCARPPAEP